MLPDVYPKLKTFMIVVVLTAARRYRSRAENHSREARSFAASSRVQPFSQESTSGVSAWTQLIALLLDMSPMARAFNLMQVPSRTRGVGRIDSSRMAGLTHADLKVGDTVVIGGTDEYPMFMHVPGMKGKGMVAKGMTGTIKKIYRPDVSRHLDRSDERDFLVVFEEPKKWMAHFTLDELASAEDVSASPRDSAYSLADEVELCDIKAGEPCEQVMQYMKPIDEVTVLEPTTSLRDAAQMFYDKKIPGAPVISDGKLVGVLTQFDFLYREVGMGGAGNQAALDSNWEDNIKKSLAGTVKSAMSKPVAVCPQADMAKVAGMMLRRRFNHVPIVEEEGKLVGILTTREVMSHVLQRLD